MTNKDVPLIRVVHLTADDCERKRSEALSRLGMSLDEARAQWDDCGCCLVHGNWDALVDLEVVREMDFLSGDGDAR